MVNRNPGVWGGLGRLGINHLILVRDAELECICKDFLPQLKGTFLMEVHDVTFVAWARLDANTAVHAD